MKRIAILLAFITMFAIIINGQQCYEGCRIFTGSHPSCAQVLAGCYVNSVPLSPPVPDILYLGQYYEFKAPIYSSTGYCSSRPLPAGLTYELDLTNSYLVIKGTPTETIARADYSIAVEFGYSLIYEFTFEIQSCPSSTPSPSSSPSSSPTLSPSCTSGTMKCVGANQYQTCNRGSWDSIQSCASDLTCSPNGDYIYCS